MEESQSVENLVDFAVQCIHRAQADDSPFYHLRFDRVFPDDFYAAMLEAMPVTDDYRALSGKAKLRNRTPDGQPTRAKIDLFPEYVRHLPQKKRAVWDAAGRVLRSKELEKVFVERLAPGLKRRFGANFAKVRMYPVPILTRDVPGYYITAHSDTLWKGITVQFDLPADKSTPPTSKFCAQRDAQFGGGMRRFRRHLSNAIECSATISDLAGFILHRSKIEARRRRTPSDIPVAGCGRNYQ